MEFTFTPKQLKTKYKRRKIKEEKIDLKAEVKAIEDGLLNDDKVSAKLMQLEDRFRRNNLQIDGVRDELNETWKTCGKKLKHYHGEIGNWKWRRNWYMS